MKWVFWNGTALPYTELKEQDLIVVLYVRSPAELEQLQLYKIRVLELYLSEHPVEPCLLDKRPENFEKIIYTCLRWR